MELVIRGRPEDLSQVRRDFGVPSDVKIITVPLRRGLKDKLAYILQVHAEARRLGRNALYFGRSSYGLLSLPRSAPLVFDSHHFPDSRRDRLLQALLFRRRRFLLLTTTMRALAEEYLRVYPRLQGRVLVVPNGGPEPRPFRAGVEKSSRLQVYYVGHLYPGRGIDDLLELARREPGMDFHVVGGEESDIERYRGMAPANAIFHGYVPPARLGEHYAKADVCISPHQRRVAAAGGTGDIAAWTCPLKLFEYMSHGKPIIASNLPAILEILTAEQDALICPIGNLAAWQEALRRLRDSADLRIRLAKASLRNATKYSWRGRAERILGEVRRLAPELDYKAGSTRRPQATGRPRPSEI